MTYFGSFLRESRTFTPNFNDETYPLRLSATEIPLKTARLAHALGSAFEKGFVFARCTPNGGFTTCDPA